jgi:hypothetical protein
MADTAVSLYEDERNCTRTSSVVHPLKLRMKVVNRDTESIVDGVRRCARQDGPGVGHFSHDTTGVKCADMEVIGAISDFIKRCNIGGKETASPGLIRKIAAV